MTWVETEQKLLAVLEEKLANNAIFSNEIKDLVIAAGIAHDKAKASLWTLYSSETDSVGSQLPGQE